MNAAVALLRSMWRWFAGAAVLILVYALAGFYLVPRLATSAIEDFVTQRLERQVTIGSLEFNPFTFAAKVTDFRLNETDGRTLIGFDELLVNVQLSSLWHRALTFAEIRLAAPDINAVIDANGAVNLAALVPPADPEETQEATTLPPIRIDLLEVLTGRVVVEDRGRRTPFRAVVTPIQFTLNDFRTTVDYQNAYRFAGTTQAGEQLEWSGQFSVQPLGSTGNFSIAGLQAATLWAYVRDQVAFTLPSGKIDLGGSYKLALNNANQIELGLELPQIRLSDFAIAPQQPEGTAPWITIPELVLTDTSFALTERRLAIQKIALNGVQADVWREKDGTINLMSLAGEATTASATPEEATAPTPTVTTSTPAAAAPVWRAEVASFEIRDAAVKTTDRGVEPAVEMSFAPVSLTLTGLTSDLTNEFDVNADIGINQSGRLLAQGKLRPTSLLADMDVELKDFDLPVLQPYVSQATAMTLGSGNFGIKGHVTYAAEPVAKQPRLKFTGGIDVTDFASKDSLIKEDFLKWKLLSLTGIDYTFGPDRLTIERILAKEPYARVIISPDAKLNVTQVLNPGAVDAPAPAEETPKPASQASAPGAAAAAPMPMRINTVVVENGSANFADFSINPSFATGIQSLAGTVQGLSSNPDSRAKVDLKGNVDRFSPVVIAGEVNLLSAALYTDMTMSFRNMELTTFNPYSGKFAGYNIAKGKLTTELKYKVNNRALEAEHHIVLDQLEFGAATESKDAVPLPIKLAVSLLKDRNGVIDINFPVRGTLDDPSFRLGPIIWKAIVGLLTKIVTAPFALLGSLFGGGEDLAFIDFPGGSPQLTEESAGKLVTLGKALVERPQLKLDIPLNVTTALDAEAIAREALAQNVPAAPAAAADDPAALQQRLQALVQAHTRIVGTAPVFPATDAAAAPAPAVAALTPEALHAQIDFVEKALLEHLAPTDVQLQTLARDRADAVQGALLGSGEIAAERVFLTTRELSSQTGGGNVRMELKLE